MEIKDTTDSEKRNNGVKRRDLLKSLAAIPIVGAMAYGIYRKRKNEHYISNIIEQELGMSSDEPSTKRKIKPGKEIRIGIIGYGIRGKQLAKGLGFAHSSMIDGWIKGAKTDKSDRRYQNFLDQDDLNIKVTAVCDIFDTYGIMSQEAGANINREGTGGKMGDQPKRFLNHTDLIESPEVDAVIIATPDHWHGPMILEAARNGKHVYCEKPMTWTVEEAFKTRKAIKENNIIFQLGHQGRQTGSYLKAKEAIEKGVLGPINLIELTTNRNDLNGAWVYPSHKDANTKTIDWEQFIGQAPWYEFSLKRFFRWRCWWDYGSGLSGDLLTHEYDVINQIMKVGIPDSAVSSGGIYFYKDGRIVHDVLTTVFEFPKQDLSLFYSATLSSQMSRGKRIMGYDAYMELGDTLTIYPDPHLTKYAKKIETGIIDPNLPIFSYIPGRKDIDAISSATERYFAGRGLLFTYRGGETC
jgi:predicted dehydrogenase